MNKTQKIVALVCLLSVVVFGNGCSESDAGRYQIHSAKVSTFDGNGKFNVEPVVFLVDSVTGKTYTYERGDAEGTLISLWRPVVSSHKVYVQTKELVEKSRGQKYMEEAKIIVGNDH